MTTYPGDFGAVPVDPITDPGTGAVAIDVPCRKCQYNLRGLPADGRCPECGTPVGYSTRGDFLRFSEPTWVGTLKRGASTILWAIVAAIFGAVAAALVSQAGYGPVPPLLLTLAGSLLMVCGSWLLTTPDPGGTGEDLYGTSRRVIRVTLAIGLLQTLLDLLDEAVHLPPTLGLALTVVAAVAGLSSVVGTFAQLNYLSKLARRIPDQPLANRARRVMYGYGISLGLVVLIGLGTALLGGPKPAGRNSGGVISLGCVAVIAVIVGIVYGINYLFMLGTFSRRLGEQAAIARATWARAGG